MSTSDYTYSTATELVAAMDARAVSAVELAEAAIERIQRYDGAVNAVPCATSIAL
jgi:amidase